MLHPHKLGACACTRLAFCLPFHFSLLFLQFYGLTAPKFTLVSPSFLSTIDRNPHNQGHSVNFRRNQSTKTPLLV